MFVFQTTVKKGVVPFDAKESKTKPPETKKEQKKVTKKLGEGKVAPDSVAVIQKPRTEPLELFKNIGVSETCIHAPGQSFSVPKTEKSPGTKTVKNYPKSNLSLVLSDEKIAVWSVYTVSAVQGKTDYGNLGYLNVNYDPKYAAKDQFSRPYNPKGPGAVVEIIGGKGKIRDNPLATTYRSDVEIPFDKPFNYVTVYDKKNDTWTDYIDASCVPGAKPEDGMVKFREGKISDLLDNKNANLLMGETYTNNNGGSQSKTRIQIVTSDY